MFACDYGIIYPQKHGSYPWINRYFWNFLCPSDGIVLSVKVVNGFKFFFWLSSKNHYLFKGRLDNTWAPSHSQKLVWKWLDWLPSFGLGKRVKSLNSVSGSPVKLFLDISHSSIFLTYYLNNTANDDETAEDKDVASLKATAWMERSTNEQSGKFSPSIKIDIVAFASLAHVVVLDVRTSSKEILIG